ncbi:MAG: TonB-dependent siderophore receptor [Pseudomonadota bacterium]
MNRRSCHRSPWRARRHIALPSAIAVLAVLIPTAWGHAQDVTVLAPITVEGDPGVITEGQDSYAWERATVGGKQPQDRRDIPQTVIVLPRQALDDFGVDSIEDAARLIPSLSEATGDGFSGSLYTRGQEVFQYFVDGAPRPFLSIYGTAPDLFFFDRFELMSGPSGVFQGSGEPVGTLNLVRKRPTDELQMLFGASGDTLGGYRLEGDIGGALNEAGTIRARIAAYGEHQDSNVAFTEQDQAGVFGTIELDLGEHTTLSAGGILEYTNALRFSGLPTFEDGDLIDIDRDTFIGSDENDAEIPNREGFVELEHEFAYGGVAKLTGRVFDQSASLLNLLGLKPVERETGDFDVFFFAREFEQTAYYADANLTSPFTVFDRPVEIVAGVDYRRTEQGFEQNFDFSPGTVNIFDFDPRAFDKPQITFPGVGPGFRLNTETVQNETGLYAQGRIEITDRVKLNLGGRFSIFDSETTDTGRGIRTEFDETDFAPYAGLTVDVLDNVTVYGSYAEIFQPQTEQSSDGATLQPRQGRQFEVGVKTEHFGGALITQASAYLIQDRNRALPDLAADAPGFFTASDEADSKGVEFLVSGSPLPGLELIAGISHVDTDLVTDPTPDTVFSAFGKYTFGEGPLRGLGLGAGVRAVSGLDIRSGDIEITAPGYAVVDAFASYEITDGVEAKLAVTNLFDRTYVERINTTSRGTFFGEPLTARFTVSARF